MNRPTPPAASAAGSLPFSIEHILSSPIKQATNVQAPAGAQHHHQLQPQQLHLLQQQQLTLPPINPLNSMSAFNLQSSPNFLSYFMACMLIQQQQQQQQQQLQQQQLEQHQQQQQQQNQQQHHYQLGPQHSPIATHSNRESRSSRSTNHLSSSRLSSNSLATPASDQSAALSSLSNFVTESLAPILSGEIKQVSSGNRDKLFRSNANDSALNKSSSSPTSSSSGGINNNSTKNNSSRHLTNGNNGNISHHRKSASLKAEEAHTQIGLGESKSDLQQNATLDLISSAAQALKSSATTAINTTLAKAPPELVQKQPAWVFCTRYSDRPSSGPRTRRAKSKDKKAKDPKTTADEKRPRTAFTSEQLEKLRKEFQANSYLDERRRKDLAERLCLNENQIKIWFQNKRAKMKKQNNQPNPLRGLLVAGGLYNHSTATSDCSESYANGNDHDDDDCDELEGISGENNNFGDATRFNDSEINSSNKRCRSQVDEDEGKILNLKNCDNEPGIKRARLNQASGSESGGNSSRADNLNGDDEEEQVISVS